MKQITEHKDLVRCCKRLLTLRYSDPSCFAYLETILGVNFQGMNALLQDCTRRPNMERGVENLQLGKRELLEWVWVMSRVTETGFFLDFMSSQLSSSGFSKAPQQVAAVESAKQTFDPVSDLAWHKSWRSTGILLMRMCSQETVIGKTYLKMDNCYSYFV